MTPYVSLIFTNIPARITLTLSRLFNLRDNTIYQWSSNFIIDTVIGNSSDQTLFPPVLSLLNTANEITEIKFRSI